MAKVGTSNPDRTISLRLQSVVKKHKGCLYLDTVLQLQNYELCSPNCTPATHVQVLVMDVPQYVLERSMKRAAFLFHNYLM